MSIISSCIDLLPGFVYVYVTMAMILMVVLVLACSWLSHANTINIDTATVVFKTEPFFVSFNMDSYIFNPLSKYIWDQFDARYLICC